MRYLTLREAIASVAIEHDPGCGCVTCRAAHGDREALLNVWLQLFN